MRTEYFYGFILSFIFGVALEDILGFGISFALFCVVLSVTTFLVHRMKTVILGSLLVSSVFLGCAFGVARFDVSQMKQNIRPLDSFVGKEISVRGIIAEESDMRDDYTNVILEGGSFRILARVPAYPVLEYGDEVVMTGKVTVPKNFVNQDTKKIFDYRTYLAKDGIYYEMYFPNVEILAHGRGNFVREKLFALKTVFTNNISHAIREPEAALASGIFLGVKGSLGDELLQRFRETGVAHIIVLSGYNIAVVAGVVSRLVMFMPLTVRLVASGLGIIFFSLMVGGGATVVRATIMALVIILARMFGRERDALRVLVLAGGFMVFVNPMILLHDVSFELSFAATLAIVVFVPIIEKYFSCISNLVLREIMATTAATQIFVLPLILYYMGSVSLISFIANIFILPVVPIAMLAGALVAMLAWVPFIGGAVALVAYLVLAYIIVAVEFFARVPFASVSGISFPLGALVVSYVVLGYVIIKNFPRSSAQKNAEYEF
ncbi:MAG: ComEC/Rec2 family competence protein [Minisyncoccota bacterium]